MPAQIGGINTKSGGNTTLAGRKVIRSNGPRGMVAILRGMNLVLRGKGARICGIKVIKWAPGGKWFVRRGMSGDIRGMGVQISGIIH